MIKMKKYDIYIGVDTGVNTGFAVWCKPEKRFLTLTTTKIHKAMKLVEEWTGDKDRTLVRVEDARLRKWFGSRSNAKLQGAGSVKRDASIWEDFLKDVGLDYEMVPPKNNITKINAEYFQQLTGLTIVTSEHARDAAMLVYGR